MEEGKNKKKKISLVLLILGIILIGVGLYFSLGNKDNKQEGNSRPSIKDDFYNYVNYFIHYLWILKQKSFMRVCLAFII